MKQYGLIGFPLSHSFSKKYFTEKFDRENIPDARYDLYPIASVDELPGLLKQYPDLLGLNVTIPHKLNVMAFLDRIDEGAKKAGAVNCIKIITTDNNEKVLEGYNTDVYGFEASLKPLLKPLHRRALVLGDGGAARAVKSVLKDLGISYQIVTRREAPGNLLFSDLKPQDIADHLLIINTTPLGTYPKVEECPPIPYEAISSKHLLYDLIYNPEQTLFLKQGADIGAQTKNGYEMLLLQAEKSWEIWTAKENHS